MNALKQLNGLFDQVAVRGLTGVEQLVLMHLYNKFNRARWTETLTLSEVALADFCEASLMP